MSIYTDELPPMFEPMCSSCDDSGRNDQGIPCACGRGVRLRDAIEDRNHALIDLADDWDAADDAPTTLGFRHALECPGCTEQIKMTRPTFDYFKAEWVITCDVCEEELGRKS